MPNQKAYRRASIIFLCIWLVFIFIPLITMVVWAFVDSWRFPDLVPPAFSLRAMTSAMNNSGNFGQIILLSVGIAIAVAVLCVIIASLTARALVHFKFPGNIRLKHMIPKLDRPNSGLCSAEGKLSTRFRCPVFHRHL